MERGIDMKLKTLGGFMNKIIEKFQEREQDILIAEEKGWNTYKK